MSIGCVIVNNMFVPCTNNSRYTCRKRIAKLSEETNNEKQDDLAVMNDVEESK